MSELYELVNNIQSFLWEREDTIKKVYNLPVEEIDKFEYSLSGRELILYNGQTIWDGEEREYDEEKDEYKNSYLYDFIISMEKEKDIMSKAIQALEVMHTVEQMEKNKEILIKQMENENE